MYIHIDIHRYYTSVHRLFLFHSLTNVTNQSTIKSIYTVALTSLISLVRIELCAQAAVAFECFELQ